MANRKNYLISKLFKKYEDDKVSGEIFMKINQISIKTQLTSAAIAVAGVSREYAHAQEIRNIAQYNLTSGVGLKGTDPVSYFPRNKNSNPTALRVFLQVDVRSMLKLQ